MKTFKNIILYFSLLLFGCETIIDVELPDTPNRITVFGYLTTSDSAKVSVSVSKDVDEPEIPRYGGWPALKDAQVEILSDNNVSILQLDSVFYQGPVQLEANNTYTIQINHPDYESISATTQIPPLPSIEQVKYASKLENLDGQSTALKVTVVFNNMEDLAYYEIQVLGKYESVRIEYDVDAGQHIPVDTTMRWSSTALYTRELQGVSGIKYHYNNILISNESIDSQLIEFPFYIEWSNLSKDAELKVIVRRIDEAYFRFRQSIKSYHETSGNPFAEPVQVYSNIENGLGVFGSYSEFSKTITPTINE